MVTKICSKCGEELDIDKFTKKKGMKDGLASSCKKCINEYSKKYRKENLNKRAETQKNYREKYPDKVTESTKKYYENNKNTIAEHKKEYRKENIDKYLDYQKKYCQENKHKIAERSRKYNEEHKDKVNERNKIYKLNNIKKVKEARSKYKSENKEKINILTQRRRARKLLLPSTFTIEDWESVKLHFNNKCAYCGEELPLQQEHFIPVNSGGGYVKENIVCSCQSCNCSKNDRNFEDWYPKHKSYNKEREIKILEYIEQNNK